MTIETIACAAVRLGDLVCSIPRPARHHNVLRQMAGAGFPIPIVAEQGFVTSAGRFVGRSEAKMIAVASGQFKGNGRHEHLFSEDVW